MICGMDVCVWKPLLATCGRDRTVRIWNYLEKTVDGVKVFKEEPHSIAIHPSGLYVLVGFTDKLRLLSLLMDDMRLVRELPVKACKEAQYSHGGHLFAVANQAIVQIFDAYTCEVKVQLRGHQQAVRSVIWAQRDRRLITVGKDGNLFLWEVRTGTRLAEFMQPRATFYAGALFGDAEVGQVVERVRRGALVGRDEAPPVDAEHRRRVQDDAHEFHEGHALVRRRLLGRRATTSCKGPELLRRE